MEPELGFRLLDGGNPLPGLGNVQLDGERNSGVADGERFHCDHRSRGQNALITALQDVLSESIAEAARGAIMSQVLTGSIIVEALWSAFMGPFISDVSAADGWIRD